ncbi:sulfite exporter TauE/SafE family protein [Ruegeria hyattellae]|uniref:sulfite exporter TauE/SafE family protein n=1 Tax=Ruegeria hyattellae TaxID=3233337 RepID=UPI00355B524B
MTSLANDLTVLIVPVLALLLAGAVKGTIGLGLPTTALGILTFSTTPRHAIALILVPMIVSNAWQVYRSGEIRAALVRYLPFIAALVIGVWLTINLTHSVSEQTLLAILGFVVVVFVLFSTANWVPYVSERLAPQTQIILGAIAGVMGGLTAVWAPPMVIYLSARRVEKQEFVRATGLLIFFGSLPLAGGYIAQNLTDAEMLALSTFLLVPTFIGYQLGEMLRARIDQQTFRRLFLFVFLLMGLNMIRRALM